MMPNQTPEQIARDAIDGQLGASGWAVQSKDTINFNEGQGQAVREYTTDSGPAAYLALYMNSKEHGQKQFTERMYGQGRPHLSFDQLRSTAVCLPPLPEQQEIVRILDEQFEAIERNGRELPAALRHSEALRQSILKRAFSGCLLPQNPADEPATALLARLRVDRAASTSTHRISKRNNDEAPGANLSNVSQIISTP